MSKRLDSITRPNTATGTGTTPTGVKPALKFKPKVVSRKSKEERENTSKINTPGVNKLAEKNSKRLANKKNGPGNKTNKKLSGTQLVISGPLSEGTISLGNSGNNMRSSSPGAGAFNPLLERLKSKNKDKSKIKKEENGKTNAFGNYNSDSDSDLDDNAIDMSKKTILENNENDVEIDQLDTDLFPVRAERNEHREYGEEIKTDKTIKTEFHNAGSTIPSEPVTRENTVGLDSKSRSQTPESMLGDINIHPNSTNEDDDGLHMNDYQEKQEIKQTQDDFINLSKSLKSLDMKNNSNNNLFFMQFPCSLPILEGGENGKIGKIQIHKSGKMTMKIGKVKFEILRGGSSDFVQEVVLIDSKNKYCYHVGGIKDKITAIPKII